MNLRIVPGSAPAGADAPSTGTKLTRATPSAANSHLILLIFCLLLREPRQRSAGPGGPRISPSHVPAPGPVQRLRRHPGPAGGHRGLSDPTVPSLDASVLGPPVPAAGRLSESRAGQRSASCSVPASVPPGGGPWTAQAGVKDRDRFSCTG